MTIEKLKELAEKLNEIQIAGRLARLKEQEFCQQMHMGVVGPQNSGKTTLINGILGQEIRQASMIPYEGKPLRICFEPMAEDIRYDCEQVFSRSWMGSDVVLYEISTDFDASVNDGWPEDELDLVFYLMPAIRLMTAEDKRALERFSGIPVIIVLTKMDDLAAEEKERVLELAKSLCQENGLSLLVSNPEDWSKTDKEIRSRLLTTTELIQTRKNYAEKVVAQCQKQLLEVVDCSIMAVKEEMDREKQAAQNAAAKQNREIQEWKLAVSEIKLACTRGRNTANEKIRLLLLNTEIFLDQKLKEGKTKGYSKSYLEALGKELDDYFQKGAREADAALQSDIRQILKLGEDRKCWDRQTTERIWEELTRPFSPETKQMKLSSLPEADTSQYLKIGAAVGGVTLAALLLPISSFFTVGAITAAFAAGGVGAYQAVNQEKTRIVQEIKAVVARQTKKRQEELYQRVKEIFDCIIKKLETPIVPQTQPVDLTKYSTQIDALELLKEQLM